jgi:hypothetical protein
MIVKRIFDGEADESVHVAFLKFGRGHYKNKYLAEGKRQAKNWAIKTSAEYVNDIVAWCLKGSGSVKMKGVIVSTLDLRDESPIDFKKVSNFQGVRKHVVDGEVESSKIFDLMDKFPKAFFALSFKGDDFVLKVKAKAPTSGKPGKEKEGGPVADFVSLKTGDESLLSELFFGVDKFDAVKIRHDIEISDIVYPEDMDSLKPAEIRERAKRRGVLKRLATVDGGEVRESRAEFVV